MLVEVITPDETLFSGSARLVSLPGSDGSFALLNRHAPIISTLKAGRLKIITQDNQTLFFEIQSGVVEMSRNKATILVEKPSQNG
ncbi:MAG: F0F1 ATP synthase subunit epsilon [Flavobacteriales bacterium]|nr:F0F1 ATP synthase subunit epsilon [Flavobacteriales bacterium]MCX7768900.1 F0F1 ATP synthase subunit epsilon [Flavobacteriales bacterium]MDW8410026.1 F0F1 ATP synthase subunit epsilon [Flavobacteriales bacterium]